MALKKLEETVKGTRILIYGPAGTKKSRFALTFPGNIYIDSDQGADSYYGEFADNIVQVSDSTTYKEVMDDLRDLEDEVDTFEAITLDNFTKIFENQQHTALNVAEQRAMKAGRNKDAEGLSYKDYGKMNLTNSIILSKLLEFKKDGKVIIVITEGKEEKEQISDGQGGTTTRVTGIIPNGPKSMQHLFDIVLETVKDKKTGETLGARVHKDRLGVVQEGTVLEDPTYDVWADVIEKRKKGVAKQAKKDIMRDLEHNEETMVGEDPTSIINEIKKILTPLTPAKKTEYQKALTSKFNTHKFMDETNIDNLKEMLNMIKQIAQ